MTIHRHAAKRDISEPEIVTALQACGATVYRLSLPVDLLVGFRGKTYLAECKTDRKLGGKDKRTSLQTEFMANWRGSPVGVLYNGQDAIDWLSDIAAQSRVTPLYEAVVA